MLSHLGWQDCSICGVLSLTNVTLHSPSLTQVELNLTKLPVSRFVLFSTATCWSAVFYKNLGGERLILKAVYHGLIAIRSGSSSLKRHLFPLNCLWSALAAVPLFFSTYPQVSPTHSASTGKKVFKVRIKREKMRNKAPIWWFVGGDSV